eukprot:CAMPEP_0114561266 /NCGR_PEP_ID=MMETSP0114-20121206/11911_1 /TAXON_ID=31324 /ORGANISM="Goniomonas sp, Strain m" /LENGTH=164 /DNA_ID=CAMNT_0001746887 /DNA_START=23 /DNA_END=514 /DNA_ORIENTATION=-
MSSRASSFSSVSSASSKAYHPFGGFNEAAKGLEAAQAEVEKRTKALEKAREALSEATKQRFQEWAGTGMFVPASIPAPANERKRVERATLKLGEAQSRLMFYISQQGRSYAPTTAFSYGGYGTSMPFAAPTTVRAPTMTSYAAPAYGTYAAPTVMAPTAVPFAS